MWGRMCHVVVKRFRYGRGMPLDLAAWLRLMERHSRRYEEARVSCGWSTFSVLRPLPPLPVYPSTIYTKVVHPHLP